MASNTTVGPAGSDKSFNASRPDNHGTSDSEDGSLGSGTNGGGEAGPVPAGKDFSNAGGGPDSDDVGLNGGDDSTVGVG